MCDIQLCHRDFSLLNKHINNVKSECAHVSIGKCNDERKHESIVAFVSKAKQCKKERLTHK